MSVDIIISELLGHYAINSAPVPVEMILQNPARDMWSGVDLSRLSRALVSDSRPFALRLALAQLLVRLLCESAWGRERGLPDPGEREGALAPLVRALLMPRNLLAALPVSALNPEMVQMMFQVPQEEASQRLIEVDVLIP